MDTKLLSAAINSRQSYDTIMDLITIDDLSDDTRVLFKKITEYYDKDDEAVEVDVDLLLSKLEREYPKHFDLFKRVLTNLPKVSSNNLVSEILEQKQNTIALKLSSALLSNKKSDIKALMEEYIRLEDIETSSDVDYTQISLAELLTQAKPENQIRIWPLGLNEHVGGGVNRQTHIIIYARPEVGKSAFAINAAFGAAYDGHTVLYVGNEDPDLSMMLRFYSRFTSMNKLEIQNNKETAEEIAISKGIKRLHFVPMEEGTIGEIEKKIKKIKPDVLVIDQILNLKFFGVEGDAETLTRAGKAVRRLTKKYNLVTISVTQAGESADGKRILDKGDIFYSNTSIPGAADLLIGIGASEADLLTNVRYITPCKNKINNNHNSFSVLIDPLLSKYISK